MRYSIWKQYRKYGLISYSVDALMDLIPDVPGPASWYVEGSNYTMATDGHTMWSR